MQQIKLKRDWMNYPKGKVMPMADGQAFQMIERGTAELITEPKKKPPRRRGKQQSGRSNKQVQTPAAQK